MAERQTIPESETWSDPDQSEAQPQMGILGSKARSETDPTIPSGDRSEASAGRAKAIREKLKEQGSEIPDQITYRCPICKGAYTHWLGCPNADLPR